MDFLHYMELQPLSQCKQETKHIRIINSRMNLFTPEITTPLELFMETEP